MNSMLFLIILIILSYKSLFVIFSLSLIISREKKKGKYLFSRILLELVVILTQRNSLSPLGGEGALRFFFLYFLCIHFLFFFWGERLDCKKKSFLTLVRLGLQVSQKGCWCFFFEVWILCVSEK